MDKNNRNIFPLLMLSNLFPLFGVLQEGWPFFLILYIFWFEMLIVTFFAELKMYFSRAGETGSEKARKMFSFGLARVGIFCFYMIFIVVFVGLLGTDRKQLFQVFRAMAFQDLIFNIAILNFLGYNFLEFLFYFILNKRYLSSRVADHTQVIDGRQIVVHVVVVLGAFLSNFILQKTGNNYYYSNLALVILFILFKMIADFVITRKPPEEPLEKYI
jgi:Family of unknown function (DUF6498)